MDKQALLYDVYTGVFEKPLIEELIVVGQLQAFQDGDVLIEIGRYIKTMPLLLSGAIKVMREDADKGELLLYFLGKGDTCAMTLACCMGDKKSEIKAVAENAGVLLMIPVGKMEEWMGKYRSWRNFILESYNNRFNELLSAIDSIAFMHLDERLENYLQETVKVNNSPVINKTHHEIAHTLNSSRVVISRLLKVLEKEGKIRLHRNNIEVLVLKDN
ncbi:Crp/Fnr family transcriptional regulator [Sphingobacterium wenxiniae]|uniref:CRP/FNR family transcriptional regulator, anaerobic regulatory protein n=1 Tax=Sphingobacterium wenxiniae TaxID=683125 RepID=A0A1I6Q055_9SPHI|nr:Crp/Fnr family transcriptional regulator [Sphingobacterium wenxiniae]SFS45708.1 CRP/FNR family transcriptional regulator, anaerobic regulatory protein [Sphingobacterium wenxiniae]